MDEPIDMNRRGNAWILIALAAIAVALGTLFTVFGSVSGATTGNVGAYPNALFNRDKVMTVELTVDKAQWQAMLDDAEVKTVIPCDVSVNGYSAKYVGIRPKGNSSLYNSRANQRHSFKLTLGEYFGKQRLLGLDEFVLNNTDTDPTWMKEYLSYLTLERLGVKTPLFALARVYVNGNYWGLYLAVESLHKSYAARSFGAEFGHLYKVEYVKSDKLAEDETDPNGMAIFGADIIYTDDDPHSYRAIFDRKEFKQTQDSDKRRVIKALKGIADPAEDISRFVEVDPILRYIAGNAMLGNDDGYFGSMLHNYYLYEKNGKLTMLPWDYNTSFGGFGRDDAEMLINVPIHEPFTSYVTLDDRPLIKRLFANESYLKTYDDYLKQAADFYASGEAADVIDRVDSLMRDWIALDPTKEYTLEQHDASVEMLKLYVKLRGQAALNQLAGDDSPVSAEGLDLFVINGVDITAF